jgi:PBP1b-binding outer membrane lipoprotein LpoB
MRRLTVLAVLTASLLLAGCSAPADPELTPTESTTATVEMDTPSPTPTIDAAALEQGFLDTVRQETGPDLISYTDEGLVEVGKSVCASLKSNVALPSIEAALTDSGFTKAAAVNVITGAGVLLCSEQGSKVLGGW